MATLNQLLLAWCSLFKRYGVFWFTNAAGKITPQGPTDSLSAGVGSICLCLRTSVSVFRSVWFHAFFFFLHLKECTRLYVCVYVCVCVCHEVCVQSVCGFYSQVRPCLLAEWSTLRVWPAAMRWLQSAQCCERSTNDSNSITFPIRNMSVTIKNCLVSL